MSERRPKHAVTQRALCPVQHSQNFVAGQRQALQICRLAMHEVTCWVSCDFLQAIVEDILLKSGLARPGTSTYGSTYMSVNGNKPVISAAVASAVEVYALDRLCSMLLTGELLL
jgi:hypothetical protein